MFNIDQRPPIYDPEAVQPMRDELVYVGFRELKNSKEVNEALMEKDKTIFVLINSVCGCAAGSARPGATLALQNDIIPDSLVTVFAGQDIESVENVRVDYLSEFPPSSPSMALIKNGEVQFMLQRHQIEGKSAEEVAEELRDVFNQMCEKPGPSISPEAYSKLVHAKECGSKIPLNRVV